MVWLNPSQTNQSIVLWAVYIMFIWWRRKSADTFRTRKVDISHSAQTLLLSLTLTTWFMIRSFIQEGSVWEFFCVKWFIDYNTLTHALILTQIFTFLNSVQYSKLNINSYALLLICSNTLCVYSHLHIITFCMTYIW